MLVEVRVHVAALGDEEVEDQAQAVDRSGDVAGRDVVGAAFDRLADLVRGQVLGNDLALVAGAHHRIVEFVDHLRTPDPKVS